MRLDKFFDSIYRPQRLLGKSSETVRLYGITLRSFAITVGTQPTLDHLTNELVTQHMQRVLDRGRTPATANKDRCHLIAIWRHAHRLGMVDRYPSVPELTEPTRTPRAWLQDEVQQLLASLDRLEGHYGHVPKSLWWTTLVLLSLDTGERIGAIRKAKWSWFSGFWVTVPAEARKGKRSDRAYRLSEDTIGHLTAIRMVSPQEVFHWPYCETYLWKLFGNLLESAGLPATRRDKFHKLRRTTASAVHAAGMDAQEALDHQYRRTTARYLDPRFTASRQPCDVLAEFLANPRIETKERRKAN